MTGLNKTLREIEAEIVHLKTQTDPDYDGGVFLLGDERVFDEGNKADLQINGEGRGAIIQGNPDNSGLPNGLVLRPSDPYDESGSGYNVGYSVSYRAQTYNPSDAGTADEGRIYEIGTLSHDAESGGSGPDWKFYISPDPYGDAQPLPAFGYNIDEDGWSDGLIRTRNSNAREFSVGSYYSNYSLSPEFKIRTDPTNGRGNVDAYLTADTGVARIFWGQAGNATQVSLSYDTGGLSFVNFGGLTDPYLSMGELAFALPRYADRTNIPNISGETTVGWDTTNNELIVNDEGTRHRFAPDGTF